MGHLRAPTGRLLALEPAPGGLQEHVVERRPGDGDRADADLLAVESPHDLGDRAGAVLDVQREPVGLGDDPLESGQAGERRLGRRDVGALDRYRHDVVTHLGLQLLRRALGDDLAVVDDRQAIAQLVGLLEVLRGEEHGRAAGVDPAHLVPDRQPRGGVQTGRRLVEEQHIGRVDERAREVEPALHPAGIRFRSPVGRLGQADELEQLSGAGPRRLPGDSV